MNINKAEDLKKIDYVKRWGPDGTVYTQTITINKHLKDNFNALLNNPEYKSNLTQYEKSNAEELKDGVNYTNLTTSSLLIEYIKINIYAFKNKDNNFYRLKGDRQRNTIIKVI